MGSMKKAKKKDACKKYQVYSMCQMCGTYVAYMCCRFGQSTIAVLEEIGGGGGGGGGVFSTRMQKLLITI